MDKTAPTLMGVNKQALFYKDIQIRGKNFSRLLLTDRAPSAISIIRRSAGDAKGIVPVHLENSGLRIKGHKCATGVDTSSCGVKTALIRRPLICQTPHKRDFNSWSVPALTSSPLFLYFMYLPIPKLLHPFPLRCRHRYKTLHTRDLLASASTYAKQECRS